jgi:hypothetical protein
LLEKFGPYGLSSFFLNLAYNIANKMQTGRLPAYAHFIVFSLLLSLVCSVEFTAT